MKQSSIFSVRNGANLVLKSRFEGAVEGGKAPGRVNPGSQARASRRRG